MATTRVEFDHWMEKIAKLDVNAFQYLNNIPTRCWSKHAFRTEQHCDILLNNHSESFNAIITEARDKPIIQCLEIVRKLVNSRITRKIALYSSMKRPIGPRIRQKFAEITKLSRYSVATWYGDQRFEVEKFREQYAVDVAKATCSCRSWDLTGIPCDHAIPCVLFLKLLPEDFIASCYHKQTLKNTYSCFMFPINGPNAWPKSPYEPVLPPSIRRPTSRPKRKRRKAAEEAPSSTNKKSKMFGSISCQRCNETGYNIRMCKGPVNIRPTTSKPRIFMGFSIPDDVPSNSAAEPSAHVGSGSAWAESAGAASSTPGSGRGRGAGRGRGEPRSSGSIIDSGAGKGRGSTAAAAHRDEEVAAAVHGAHGAICWKRSWPHISNKEKKACYFWIWTKSRGCQLIF